MADLAGVSYDASDLVEVVRQLEARGQNLAHFTPSIAEELVAQVEEVFLEEGAVPGGKRWEDLADSTKASRRGTEPYTILRDTAVLFNSIQPSSGPSEAAAGTDVPYSIYHVSKEPRTKIPLRDFTAIDFEGFTDSVAEMLLQDVIGA